MGTVPLFQFLSPSHLCLHQLPFLRFNNGRVAVAYIVLGHLTLVALHLFLQEIYCKGLLEDRIALVFFVLQNTLHCGDRPLCFAAGCGDTLCCENLGNGAGGLALHKHCVDPLHNGSLFRYDFRCPILTLAVAKEGPVGHRYFAISKSFPLTPCDILGNGSAFFLCQGGHNGNQQFAFAVQCPYIFLLKVHFNTGILQPADGCKAVHGISGKATY